MEIFSRIKIRNKLVLMAAIPFIGLIFFSLIVVWEKYTLMHEMKKLHSLTELAVKINLVVHELQKERGMSAGFLGSGGVKFKDLLPDQRGGTDKRISELDAFLRKFDRNSQSSDFKIALEKAVNAATVIKDKRDAVDNLKITLPETLAYYTGTITSLHDIVSIISTLSSNAEVSAYLSSFLYFSKGKEKAGVERAALNATFASNKFAPGMYDKFITLLAEQNTFINMFLSLATEKQKQFYKDKIKGQYVEEVAKMRNIAIEKSVDGDFGVDPVYWFRMKTGEIDLLKEVEDYLAENLLKRSGQLQRNSQLILLGIIAVTVIGFILTGGVIYLVTGSITRPVGELSRGISVATNGDLTQRLHVEGTDELAKLSSEFNEFMVELQKIIDSIRSSAGQVASASSQLSATSEQMSKGMKRQAQQAAEIASSVEEMTASVHDVAKNAQGAAMSAKEAASTAYGGKEVVSRSIEGMNGISETVTESARTIGELGKGSEQIGEVISVINDIADQTNLLALNAAIEAARAGEQGRGFAVVADEVRKLAERTTKATKEIAAMIKSIQEETKKAVASMESGTKKVDDGVELANKAGDALSNIVEVVNEVNDMIQQIAAASEEQSASAEGISSNVESIATVSKEAEQGANQVSSSSYELSRMAVQLQEMVGRFRI